VKDPSCDLAVALAIVSSFKEKIVKKDIVIIGEVGLASEIRNVTQVSLRIKEAQKLGFKQCIIPKNNLDNKESYDIELTGVRNIQEAMEHAF